MSPAFESRQITHSVRVTGSTARRSAAELPKGWEGSFELERGSSAVDDFIAAAEQQYFNGSSVSPGTLYQYVTETDGSTSTYQYDNVMFRLSNAGTGRAIAASSRSSNSLQSAGAASDDPIRNHHCVCRRTQSVTDSDGRRLTLRRLTALDRLRLFKAAGPVLAQNQPWLGMALLACSVAGDRRRPGSAADQRSADRSAGRSPGRCRHRGNRPGPAERRRNRRAWN